MTEYVRSSVVYRELRAAFGPWRKENGVCDRRECLFVTPSDVTMNLALLRIPIIPLRSNESQAASDAWLFIAAKRNCEFKLFVV